MPVNRIATIRLITKLNNPDIKFQELEEALSQDVSLSYKLLRYTNSAVCGLQREVESIRHAAVLVGLERMRIWASLILFSGMEDKPRDLIVTGAIRARMCEKLAESLKISQPERCFLVGLFSVLDAVFDRPLDHAYTYAVPEALQSAVTSAPFLTQSAIGTTTRKWLYRGSATASCT